MGCAGIVVHSYHVYFDKVTIKSNALVRKVADAPDYMTAVMITVTLGGMQASRCFREFTEGNGRGQVFNPSTRNGNNIPSTSHFQSLYYTS